MGGSERERGATTSSCVCARMREMCVSRGGHAAQMSANHTSGGRPSACAGGDRCRCLGCRTKLSLLITTTSSKIGGDRGSSW
eukprot:scaffold8826_cov63-Phaeocystis_antarctica.AAC.2